MAALFCAVVFSSSSARAQDVGPGETLTLSGDIVLTGAGTFEALGQPGKRCTIVGQGASLRSAPGWTGRVNITYCDLVGMGSATAPAIDLQGSGSADVTIVGSVLDRSGAIHLQVPDQVTVTFRDNTILESSVVPMNIELADSRPAFLATDDGTGTKVFQGNRVYRAWVELQGGRNWLIGGPVAQGNVLVGRRAGLVIQSDVTQGTDSNIRVIGNYIYPTPPYAEWNQMSALDAEATGVIVEHNVIRGGSWLVRAFSGGELRYNLLADPYGVSWVNTTGVGNTKIHHNLMTRTITLEEAWYRTDGIQVLSSGGVPGNTQFYNNTIDGGGHEPMGGAVAVFESAFLNSLRSNAFFNMRAQMDASTAFVRPGYDQNGQFEPPGDPGAARLGYADYNLFYNPNADRIDNYGIAVAGKTERRDPGFGLNDAPAGGMKDQQVEPNLTGPLPGVFPFSEARIKSGETLVCEILAYYRAVYMPATTSPLVDMGDPADGDGNDIGAIGAGKPNADDRFGRDCPAGTPDVGEPPAPPAPPAGTVPPSGDGPGTEPGNDHTPKAAEPTSGCSVTRPASVPMRPALGLVVAAVAIFVRRSRRLRRDAGRAR